MPFCFLRPSVRTHILRSILRSLGEGTPMHKINIAEKFDKITEYWKPYIAAELNGQHVKLDKLKGEFIFHHHEHEDELFLVVKGRFRMEYREDGKQDRHQWIEEGEFIV